MGPLGGAIGSRKDDGAYDAIAIHDGAPLLIAESAVRVLTFFDCGGERGFQLAIVGHLRAVVGVWVGVGLGECSAGADE